LAVCAFITSICASYANKYRTLALATTNRSTDVNKAGSFKAKAKAKSLKAKAKAKSLKAKAKARSLKAKARKFGLEAKAKA